LSIAGHCRLALSLSSNTFKIDRATASRIGSANGGYSAANYRDSRVSCGNWYRAFAMSYAEFREEAARNSGMTSPTIPG